VKEVLDELKRFYLRSRSFFNRSVSHLLSNWMERSAAPIGLFASRDPSYNVGPSVHGTESFTQMRSKDNHKTAVFVCTGNFYRSRFAEYFFNALAKEVGLPWRATSRGLRAKMAENEGPISEFAAYRLTAMDVPFDGERFPIQLCEADLANADLVIAIKRAEHYAMMAEQFPAWADRIEYWDVHDMDCATANEALPVLQARIEALVDRLASLSGGRRRNRPHSPSPYRRSGALPSLPQ
jgi:protein-tyrosine phosphatase